MNDKAHLANIDVKIYVLWQYRESKSTVKKT